MRNNNNNHNMYYKVECKEIAPENSIEINVGICKSENFTDGKLHPDLYQETRSKCVEY